MLQLTVRARELGCPLVAVGDAPAVNHGFSFVLILFGEDDVSVACGSGGRFPKPSLNTAASNLVVGVWLCRRDGCGGWWCCPSESGWVSLVCWAGMPWYATSALP